MAEISWTTTTKTWRTDLEDTLLYSFWYGELMDVHIAGLAQTMSTVKGLILKGRVPPQIHKDDIVATGKVKTRAAGLEGDQDDLVL